MIWQFGWRAWTLERAVEQTLRVNVSVIQVFLFCHLRRLLCRWICQRTEDECAAGKKIKRTEQEEKQSTCLQLGHHKAEGNDVWRIWAVCHKVLAVRLHRGNVLLPLEGVMLRVVLYSVEPEHNQRVQIYGAWRRRRPRRRLRIFACSVLTISYDCKKTRDWALAFVLDTNADIYTLFLALRHTRCLVGWSMLRRSLGELNGALTDMRHFCWLMTVDK